jgi:drug/metabolite transporter (DMT)-like permease
VLRADLALAGVTMIWGATFVVVKTAIEDVSTLLFLGMRFSLATVAVLAFYRGKLSGTAERSREWLAGGVLAGVCLILGYLFQTSGLRYTSASISAFITGLTTVMVPFLGSLVYRSAPHPSEGLGAALATGGLALLTLRGQTLSFGKGELLTLGCTVAYASHILVLGRYSRRAPVELLSVTQLGTAAVLASGTCWWLEKPRLAMTPAVIAGVLITGLLATALAFSVQAWAQQHTTPQRVALIFALEPVFAAVTSHYWLSERMPATGILGAAMILVGIVIAELKPIGGIRHPVE